jgi:hypothetical protein
MCCDVSTVLAGWLDAACGPARLRGAGLDHAQRADAGERAGGQGAHARDNPATARLGEPFSTVASNIDPADTRSTIAPRLPTPTALENDAPAGYLKAARQALDARRTGAAQQALEMAETRLLDRSVPKGSADVADQAPAVMMVRNALTDLGRNDLAGARAKIDTALADIGQAPQRI